MLSYIENYKNPQIGDFFLVRTVEFNRNGRTWNFPVFSKDHSDGKYGLAKPHYHIDWRFMPDNEVIGHNHSNKLLVMAQGLQGYEILSPIMTSETVREYYSEFQYLRDFNPFPGNFFVPLQEKMKDCTMKDMKCPHHGTNLTSCKPFGDVVTCPQHGLKWNIKTGELVN